MKDQKTKRELSIPEFVANLKKELKNIKAEAPFLSFLCMSACIEMLGALIDQSPVDERDLSWARFDLAINELFDSKYRAHSGRLYKKLRCPLVHRLQVEGVVISHFGNDQQHLQFDKNKNLILALDPLMTDMLRACDKVIQKFNENKALKSSELFSYCKVEQRFGFDVKGEPSILLSSLSG